jgi:hypothetical protein
LPKKVLAGSYYIGWRLLVRLLTFVRALESFLYFKRVLKEFRKVFFILRGFWSDELIWINFCVV